MARNGKITIIEAIKEVMTQHGKPMSVKKIYHTIIENNLY
ncbi:MAG: HTH domain-containing protein [Thainema sp.]